jgi:hypothetical protein
VKKVITTFAFGPQRELLDVCLPTFARYAEIHGYDLYVPAEKSVSSDDERPFPWLKIPLLLSLFAINYEAVLWLDADVIVRRYEKDILEDSHPTPLAMAVHRTDDGDVPNSGVWIVRNTAVDFLRSLWPLNSFRRSSGWWEQAAVIAALGGDPDAGKVSVPEGPLWGELPYEWNPHIADNRGIPEDCRFFHATMFPDRKAAMLHYARFS